MAALDFGMALARGLVAPHAGYQETVKSAAGGVGIFKSEDWWNKQLDQGIKQGFNETVTSRVAPNTFQGRNGFNQKMVTQKGYDSATPVYEEYYRRRGRAGGLEKLPINTPNVDRRFYTVDKKLIGYDATKVQDVTQGVLSKISAQSKRQGEIIRTEGAKQKAGNKRLSRATGGLLAKSPILGVEGMLTGLPILGEGGLGIDSSSLGGKTRLG